VDTLTILGTLHNTLRAWKNPAALKVAELESKDSDLWEIFNIVAGAETKKMYQEGDTSAGVIACSQSIGLVSEIESVATVINDMVVQAHASIQQLNH
jgi:nitronate monooxygenase